MEDNKTSETIRVLFLSPGKKAEMREIEHTLESMQSQVGGMIEEYMPFDDDAAIVCNEEGKMMGLPLNRAVKDEDGRVMDIICGDFFICYAPIESEEFLSLPPEMEKKYKEKFAWPETFMQTENGIRAVAYEPKEAVKMRDDAR